MNLAPTPMMTSRLVKKHKEARFWTVLLALFGVLAIFSVVATFPLMVEHATHAVVQAREGANQARSSAGAHFSGRKSSPFLVTVENGEQDFRGSGALVNDIYVLTAAHNVATLDLARKHDVITSPSVLTVSIREEWDKPLQTRRVLKTWVHKAFSSGVGSEKMIDLAVLELESPFAVRPKGAADYWESAVLAQSKDLGLEVHGARAFAGAFGRVAELEGRHVAGKHLGPAETTLVACGDPHEWLQNNNTLCFAPNSKMPPRVCSGDDGVPLAVSNAKGQLTVIGIVVSPPRSSGCRSPSPHRWGVAISVARLHDWIEAVIRNKPFAASRASSLALVDHDSWTDGDQDGEVYCDTHGSAFRVFSVQPKGAVYDVKHCATGRLTSVPRANLTQCKQPCKLLRVRTTSTSLETLALNKFSVRCSKSTGAAFLWTGRRTGFQFSDSVQMEVMSCAGSVPKWVLGSDLVPCPESVCIQTTPIDFEKNLTAVCDRVGNAALATGHKSGFWRTESVFVPVVFQQRLQVMPCHGGPPMWIYGHALRSCVSEEISRCRGPEAIARKLSSGEPVRNSLALERMREGPLSTATSEMDSEINADDF